MKILKKFTSTILAIIMAISCLMIANVVSTMAMTQNNRIYDFFGSHDMDGRYLQSEYSYDKTVFPDAVSYGGANLDSSGTTGTYYVYGKSYELSGCVQMISQFKVVVPDFAVDASLSIVGRRYSKDTKLTLAKEDGTVINDTVTLSSEVTTVTYDNLEAGETYVVTSEWPYMAYSLLALNVTYNCYNISGKVSDENGNGIPLATVTIGEDTVTRTDSTGNYAVEYMAGAELDTTMKVTAIGYEDKEEPLSTNDDCTIDFVLSKKGEKGVYNYFMGSTDASNNYGSNVSGIYELTNDTIRDDVTRTEATYNVGGSSYKLSTFAYKQYIQITIPEGITNGKLYMVADANTYDLLQDDVVIGEKVLSESTGVVSFEGLSTGVYNLNSKWLGIFPCSLLVLEDNSSEADGNTYVNVTNSVTAVDNGLVSDISTDSPFNDMVTDLNSTDKLFTLVGVVNSERSSSQFASEIDKVGFMLYDADVVDALGENAKTKNPQQLNANFTASDYKDALIQTDEVYKNFYDAENYNADLDSDEEYTGTTSQESSSNKSYFAYVVALGQGKRYYAYPYTLYSGASQNTYDTVVNDRIEISNVSDESSN